MPEPRNDRAPRPAGRGRMRASHADREQVVDILKDAYVQDRLTKDEFDSRVGDALASRTHAELAALTADLPVGAPTARPRRKAAPARPRRPDNATVKKGAIVIAATSVLTGSVWAGALISNTDSQALATLVWSFTFLWLGIVMLVAAVMLESRLQDGSGGQPPPASGDGGQSDKRAVTADPPRPLRPGDHAAEASRIRPSFRLQPRLNPS
jgi:Domain of unknown function (DUF1707)